MCTLLGIQILISFFWEYQHLNIIIVLHKRDHVEVLAKNWEKIKEVGKKPALILNATKIHYCYPLRNSKGGHICDYADVSVFSILHKRDHVKLLLENCEKIKEGGKRLAIALNAIKIHCC